jgi:ferrochelatase
VGVLVTNLGSPEAPTPAAVRRFLAEFLADPLVVDAPPVLWWLVRQLFVLPFRPAKSAALYRRVWTPEGSPLLVQARRFARALEAELGVSFRVALGMRYGSPSTRDGLRALLAQGCRRMVVLPGYPQASRTTTGTGEREIRRVMAAVAPGLPLAFVRPYFDSAGYVGALAASVRQSLAQGPVDHLVFSFHGLPERLVEAGDPYREHCQATAAALARELGLVEGGWTLAYQSRFGRERWLGPDVAVCVPALARRCPRVLVAAPGFTLDCLETLEELDLRLAASFQAAGGVELRRVPALNDRSEWVRAAAELVLASVPR